MSDIKILKYPKSGIKLILSTTNYILNTCILSNPLLATQSHTQQPIKRRTMMIMTTTRMMIMMVAMMIMMIDDDDEDVDDDDDDDSDDDDDGHLDSPQGHCESHPLQTLVQLFGLRRRDHIY